MPTIAIVGAGPGLGLSIAKQFGRNGFQVALISRTLSKLDDLAAQRGQLGIDATGFAADVMDPASLIDAFARITARYGAVDVLEYSPAPHTPVPGVELADALAVTLENVQPQIDYYLYGAITAVRQVLPAMLARGTGTLLFTTGASSVEPNPKLSNVGIATAGLRNWVLALHPALAELGIYVAHVPLAVWIGRGGPETQPDAIAPVYWTLYTQRDTAERLYRAG